MGIQLDSTRWSYKMRTIEFLNTVVDGAGALGSIPFDPFLAALASLKTTDGKTLVSHWINPEPEMAIVETSRFRLRDAANATMLETHRTSDIAPLPSKTNNINGKPTYTVGVDNANALRNVTGGGGLTGINKERWSLLAVCQLEATNGEALNDQRVFGIGTGSLGADILWPVLEVSGGTAINVREGGTTTRRVTGDFTGLTGSPVLVGGAFSIEQGVAVFKNNMEGLARNASDKRPLTQTDSAFMGDRFVSNPAIGDFGMALILRDDITKPEYSAAREVILGGLMNRYGIT
ncbi:hypothetical protein ACDI10_09820 [Vreelandella venusta]|uniref:hypothetical protein n=1 Tax=Vreelandella venusta TaxID=44935 RepID=UPI003558659A